MNRMVKSKKGLLANKDRHKETIHLPPLAKLNLHLKTKILATKKRLIILVTNEFFIFK